ncbi:uncharacterized protein RhoGEF64C [Prorops nasuta]|uniref:uncharacterized protein RhoGEF64C n=1 Tax=Prorops nasuta TaxID=863751 RepID=UPI0034CF3992
MTSIAVVPANLASTMYHVQQQPTRNVALAKSYEYPPSKGKKSWSVRLGLSGRQQKLSEDGSSESGVADFRANGSLLSRQMMHGEPWLYGTVRSPSNGLYDGRITEPSSALLVVCSCPEFMGGTTRRLGTCPNCGTRRLLGLTMGGTCRLPMPPSRSRPSLAGILRPSTDDPYDLMRRSRLGEARSRARSTSPQSIRALNSFPRLEWVEKVPEVGREADRWKRLVNNNRSILECDVNPYTLLKKSKEDDSSDELSDNALELEDRKARSNLFDPSKVKSIERIPNGSAFAAIGGQRIRVFNDPRPKTRSDDEDEDRNVMEDEFPVTRIPIPKISPKRPPRRLKEVGQSLKSILKRGKVLESKRRKNVHFNVDNVIFAPEKPASKFSCVSVSSNNFESYEEADKETEPRVQETEVRKDVAISAPSANAEARQDREPIRTHRMRHNFITIPNIKEPKLSCRNAEVKPEKTLKNHAIKLDSSKISTEDTGKSEEKKIDEENIQKLKSKVPFSSKIAVDEKDLILKSEENRRKSLLIRSQSERSLGKKPRASAGTVLFADTMRLNLTRRAKDDEPRCNGENSRIIEDEEKSLVAVEASGKSSETIETNLAGIEENDDAAKKSEPSNLEERPARYFQRMRPTSWSPPPGRQKHSRKNEAARTVLKIQQPIVGGIKILQDESSCALVSSESTEASRVEIKDESTCSRNVCKITVSPRETTTPMVHRLQVGVAPTSIMINSVDVEPMVDNKVTISVGGAGQDTVCNPTVISVSSSSPTMNHLESKTTDNRTLVILDNNSSNIVLPSEFQKKRARLEIQMNRQNQEDRQDLEEEEVEEEVKPVSVIKCKSRLDRESLPSIVSGFSRVSSKEAIISKILEDSLRKAKDNGEIVDEGSGEAILRILKQSLLKSSKEYESSESTIEANYSSKSSSLTSEADFNSGNLFFDENLYEMIKEPIYEEIPEDPPLPPLPTCPPPTNHHYDKSFFGDGEIYYYAKRNNNTLESYNDIFAKPFLSPDLGKKMSSSEEENITTKFELLNFLIDSKSKKGLDDDEDDEEDEEDEEEEEEEEEERVNAERDLEALYEQKEISLGDLSSKSSQISNISDSSEECNIILTSSPELLKTRTVDIERTDSGVGSESSHASSTRGATRRWRTGSPPTGNIRAGIPQATSRDTKLCEDCEQRLDPLITDSGVVYAPFVCRKCSKKRAERKEIITEIVETEQKYGRDLQIILDEFHRPMLKAGLLNSEQLSAVFLNVQELLEHNATLAEKLKDAVEIALESGDEDLLTVDVGSIFLESERMLHAFESYCTRQGTASLLLQNLEKEKELLRIFLKVSQMENTVLRRMNLNSFLMVPVQRVTKYPLLLARLLKATPSVRPDIQEAKTRLKQAQTNIELHLEHMNAEAKDITSTKLWRRISIIQNGRRSIGEQDMVNIKLRKMAVEILEWAHEEARFILEGRLLIAQPTDNNWRRGRTIKLSPVTAMLVTNGKSNIDYHDFNDESLFSKHIGVKEATLLLVKEKIGRYSLLREPLYLDKCIVCCEADFEDYFEIQELSSKETFIIKAEDGTRTKRWCKILQAHAQSLGAWRKRRGALPNIMICSVARS